jgi:hypothetical protein
MNKIKLFKEFNNTDFYKKIQDLVNNIPDSDLPSETNIITTIDDKLIFTEGWCDRCFINYDLDNREEMVNYAKKSTEKRMRDIPNLPQYKNFKDKKLIDFLFIELPDNSLNYGLSIGIFK